jgi:hypothetical protein
VEGGGERREKETHTRTRRFAQGSLQSANAWQEEGRRREEVRRPKKLQADPQRKGGEEREEKHKVAGCCGRCPRWQVVGVKRALNRPAA